MSRALKRNRQQLRTQQSPWAKAPDSQPQPKQSDMGFNFSFFGKQEVRRFSYKPRFYDPEAEERRKKYGDFTKPKGGYTPGSHIKGSLRDGNYKRTRDIAQNQKVIGIITTLLLFAVVYLIYRYFPILIDSLTR